MVVDNIYIEHNNYNSGINITISAGVDSISEPELNMLINNIEIARNKICGRMLRDDGIRIFKEKGKINDSR